MAGAVLPYATVNPYSKLTSAVANPPKLVSSKLRLAEVAATDVAGFVTTVATAGASGSAVNVARVEEY